LRGTEANPKRGRGKGKEREKGKRKKGRGRGRGRERERKRRHVSCRVVWKQSPFPWLVGDYGI